MATNGMVGMGAGRGRVFYWACVVVGMMDLVCLAGCFYQDIGWARGGWGVISYCDMRKWRKD